MVCNLAAIAIAHLDDIFAGYHYQLFTCPLPTTLLVQGKREADDTQGTPNC